MAESDVEITLTFINERTTAMGASERGGVGWDLVLTFGIRSGPRIGWCFSWCHRYGGESVGSATIQRLRVVYAIMTAMNGY